MELNRVIMTVCLGGILLVVAYVLAFRRRAADQEDKEDHEQEEEEEEEKRQERGEKNERPQQTLGSDPPQQKPGSEESGKGSSPEAKPKLPVADVPLSQKESSDSSFPSKQEYESLMTRTQSSDVLSQRVHDLKNHLVLLRKYVCRQAYGKGRALLEALGLTKAQIAKYYGMYPQNEEEAVQDGLQAWIGGSLDSTWSDLLEAMETAGIDIQQREGLKGELCGNAGGVQVVKAKARAGPTVVPEATVERSSIIPDIKAEYVKVKGVFVKECEAQGTPTLEEVKDHCIDLIEGVLNNMPKVMCHEDDIEQAKTLPELARVVCFRLSTWISYDFFKKVIAQFQPALKTVEEQLMCYEDTLKHLLQEKLVNIAELQQREEDSEVPSNMAEFAVKYDLDSDGICVKELIAKKDFLAQRLGIPKHHLQVLSWGRGSVVITYRVLRDVLPLAELALYREDTRKELTQHGVKNVYFAEHFSQQPNLVDQSPQTVHLQRRAIVTVLDEHRQDLDVSSLTSDLKDMGVLTAEQCQKLASLDDRERRHEALLYTLLAQDGPDTYDKLVECMGSRDVSIAEDLQATFSDVKTLPGALSVIPSSPGLVKPTRDWKNLGPCLKVIQHSKEGGRYNQVAVSSEGLLAVTDSTNKCVHLLTKEGALVRSIGEGMLRGYLCGIVFDLKGNVWVIDRGQYMNNKVLKLSQDGRLLQDICQLVKDGHFQTPNGMSVSPDGLIYICDYDTHRVTVHDDEGKYQFAFGSKGSGPGLFTTPRDITFGSDGLVYVTDTWNNKVSIWSKEGTHKRDFQTKYNPTCIAATADNHLLITSYSSNTVMVYTLDGPLVHEFGVSGPDPGRFNRPLGICVDNDGLVYVVDHHNRRVQVF